MPTAACSHCAAGSATTMAPARPMASRSPTTPRPMWSAPTCCRPIASTSSCASPTWCRSRRCAAPAGRRACMSWSGCSTASPTTLGLTRDEVRRRNMIQPAQMPYATPIKQRDGSTMTYDSGDYPESQRRALAAVGWSDFPARQAAARQQGRFIGIGLANYVEGTGRGPFESATLRVGAIRQGRGHHRRDGAGPGHADHAGAARRRCSRRARQATSP